MIEQSGFLQPRRVSPATMATIVLAHGAILAALALAHTQAFRAEAPGPFVVRSYPQPDNPPPPPPPRAAHVAPRSTIDTAPVIVPVALDPPLVAADDHPVIALPSDPVGAGDRPAVPEPAVAPPPAPVLVAARPDPAHAGEMQPPYPAAMERVEREGTATVRVLIGIDGRVKAAEATAATDPAFGTATTGYALRHWRFRPATRDGAAVESWTTITVRFVLPR